MLAARTGLGPRITLAFWCIFGFIATALAWSLLVGDWCSEGQITTFGLASGTNGSTWAGFDKLKDVVVFGDSYSTTYFDPEGNRPTLEQPFGNQDVLKGAAQNEGPKWIEYLQSSYSASQFKVTNFAERGATTERHAYEPRPQGIAASELHNTLKEEISIFQGSDSARRKPFVEWTAETTLFATWFGVNDVYGALEKGTRVPYEAILATYGTSFDRLYRLGARNFLIMNVPPVDVVIGPHTFPMSNPSEVVREYNKQLSDMHRKLIRRMLDANFFFFDVNTLWTKVIAHPTHFAPWADIRNTQTWCSAYAWESNKLDDYQDKCGERRDRYFWLDNKHATHVVQNLTAAMIAEDCFIKPGYRGYCRTGPIQL